MIGPEVDDTHQLFRLLGGDEDNGVQGLMPTSRGVIYRADGTLGEIAVAASLSRSFRRLERAMPERGMVPL